ncbi:MAG: hypothetical protein ACRD3W_30485 [Terriglobales bacterium]
MATKFCGRAKEGEWLAFFALFQIHAAPVYSQSLRTTGDIAAAENLTREIFCEAFSNLDAVTDDAAFATRLYDCAAKRWLANGPKPRNPQGFGHRLGPHQHLSFAGRGNLATHSE